jgi:hypothetical protein
MRGHPHRGTRRGSPAVGDPIVFLDFDGVLNSAQWMQSQGAHRPPFDPAAVARLNVLIKRTGARVVVSSSWRKDVGTDDRVPYVQGILTGIGCHCYVVGATPYGAGIERGLEIQQWIDTYPKRIGAFVILDDDSDMAHLAHRLVQTNWETGLLDEHVERAAAMLAEPPPPPNAPKEPGHG